MFVKKMQRYTFILNQQNDFSEPNVMAPINIDGDTRLLMFFAAFYFFSGAQDLAGRR